MNFTLIGILIYVAVQLAIGFIVSRRIKTENDYLLAGKSLGYWLATFSIFATWFGAESCIGSAGVAYAEGVGGISSEPFGYAVCLLFMGLFFATRLWNMNLKTVADFFALRFSPATEKLVAVLMIPTSLFWSAAQIRAFGVVLASASDIEVTFAISIAAAIVIIYTMSGGLLADAITDIVQGVVLIVGLLIAAVLIFRETGFPNFTLAVTSVGAASGGASTFMDFLRVIEAWAIPICGSLIAQELVSRILGSRSVHVAKRSTIMAGLLYALIGFIPLSIGIIGTQYFPSLDNPEQILSLMAQKFLPATFFLLFAGALVSAILSTVDSSLLAVSSLFMHNLIIPLRPMMTEKKKVTIERFGVFAGGILAYALALYAEGIYHLVKDASSFGSAGLFVVFLFGMYSRRGDARAAIATMVCSAIVWIVAYYGFAFELSYILALVTAVVVYYVMSRLRVV